MTLEDRIRAKQARAPMEPKPATNYIYDCGLCSTPGNMVQHDQDNPCPKEPSAVALTQPSGPGAPDSAAANIPAAPALPEPS